MVDMAVGARRSFNAYFMEVSHALAVVAGK